jgi:hypothetical protein
VEAVHDVGMGERSTFIVVSDHGFKRYTKQTRPAVALAAAGLAGTAYILPEGGSAFVYFDQSQAAELAPKVIRALESLEGIDKIIRPDGNEEFLREWYWPMPDMETTPAFARH